MHDDLVFLIQDFKNYLFENEKSPYRKRSLKLPRNLENRALLKVSENTLQPKISKTIVTNPPIEFAAPLKPETKSFKTTERKLPKIETTRQDITSSTSFTYFVLEPPMPKQIVLEEMRNLIQTVSPTFQKNSSISLYHSETSIETVQFLNDIAKAITLNFFRSINIHSANEKLDANTILIISTPSLAQTFGIKEELHPHTLYSFDSKQSFLTIYPPSNYINNNHLKKGLWEALKKIVPKLP